MQLGLLVRLSDSDQYFDASAPCWHLYMRRQTVILVREDGASRAVVITHAVNFPTY